MLCSKCSSPTVPVVALDIDGTMGQYHEHLLNFFELYFGREFDRGWHGQGNWEDYLGIPHSAYAEGKLAFRQGGFKRWMPMTPDANLFSHTIHDQLEAEVWITTTRPYLRLDSVDPDSRWWLEKNDIYYDHLLYDDEKYSRLGALVDPKRVCSVLDDLPAQWNKAAVEFGRAVPTLLEADHNLMWRTMAVPDTFTSAANLADAMEIITFQVDRWNEIYA